MFLLLSLLYSVVSSLPVFFICSILFLFSPMFDRVPPENRKALLARQKRLEKSREKNPNLSEKQKKVNNNTKLEVAADRTVAKELTDKNEFSGMTADPKQKGLPTHSGLCLHRSNNLHLILIFISFFISIILDTILSITICTFPQERRCERTGWHQRSQGRI